jgi:hypothetical protein
LTDPLGSENQRPWIPAFAGMTANYDGGRKLRVPSTVIPAKAGGIFNGRRPVSMDVLSHSAKREGGNG